MMRGLSSKEIPPSMADSGGIGFVTGCVTKMSNGKRTAGAYGRAIGARNKTQTQSR